MPSVTLGALLRTEAVFACALISAYFARESEAWGEMTWKMILGRRKYKGKGPEMSIFILFVIHH